MQTLPAEQTSRQGTPQPTLPTPGPFYGGYERYSVDMLGRMALTHYNCDEDDHRSIKELAWRSVDGLTRLAIGNDVLHLNNHGVDWKSFDDLDDMRDAAKAI